MRLLERRPAARSVALVALAISLLAGRAEAEERRIAVLQFTSRKVNADLVEMLADRARQGALAAAKGSPYSVMTRENTVFLVKQNGGVCTEGECEVETGKLIGAALVLTGNASFLAKTWVVDLKIHDTEKGRLVGATSVDATSELALLKATLEATSTMVAAAIESLKPPAVAPPPPVVATPAPAAAGPAWLTTPISSTTPDGRAAEQDRTRCLGGNAAACTDLGYKYRMGTGIARDDARAIELYRRACDGGNMKGCTNLALLYRKGIYVARDDARAVELYRRACDGGDATGCASLGIHYETGDGVSKDATHAAELYRRACDAGEAMGCSYLGDLYTRGRGVPRDKDLGRRLITKGCDGGDGWGCNRLKEL